MNPIRKSQRKTNNNCPCCGFEVPSNILFCERCGMRIHINQSNNKSTLRSTYIFHNEQDYENAKNAIYYGNHDIYNKLDWYGSSYSYNNECVWVVKLYDDLTQEELEWAVCRIREHRGQYYQD